MSEQSFSITLAHEQNYRFAVHFDDPAIAPLITDETPPLGENAGPNPSRLLATAIANCLAASLLFALRKFRNTPEPVTALATVQVRRNEAGRLRIGRVDVELGLGKRAEDLAMLERALSQFEEFCVVTQSVRDGIDVQISVRDVDGKLLKGEPT